jgi:hypothetical protein
MTQYLVAIYRPENYDPAVSEDGAMRGRCGCSPLVR